ncbi:MAG: helix-hairpin-helix domain-containing protein [Dermatophilaceae bacterium]
MPRRHDLDAVSVRALAYLRTARGGYPSPTGEFAPRAAECARALDGRPDVERPSAVTMAGPWPPGHAPEHPEHGRGSGPAGEGEFEAADDDTGRHRRHRPFAGLVRLPTALAGARWQPGRSAVLGVVLAAVVVIVVLGLRVAWSNARPEETVSAPGGAPRAGATGVVTGAVPVGAPPSTARMPQTASAGPGGAPEGLPSSATASAVVAVVHVVGQVRRAGVYRLPAGSRVSDAVAAAQGATTKADLARVNLARVVVDGEQVRVPAPGEPTTALPGAPPGSPATAGSSAPGTTARALVSLNGADLAALDTLPGVGPVLAQRILDWRAEHGQFTSVDELGEVSGIGEKVLGHLRPLVTL